MTDAEELRQIRRFSDLMDPRTLKTPEEALAMSDHDFREYYIALMRTHRVTRKWWRGVVPSCTHCGEDIGGSEQLRMYESQPYHPHCFAEVYTPDDYTGTARQYFDRVLKMP